MTIFLRVVEISSDQKSAAILRALASLEGRIIRTSDEQLKRDVFVCDSADFSAVTGSPFAYWLSPGIRGLFKSLPAYANGQRTAGVGVQTNDDFRFVRLWFEIRSRQDWPSLARGGRYGAIYGDLPAVLNWRSDGYELKASIAQRYGSASRHIQKEELYFTPGITWPLRGVRLQAVALPENCIFSMAGKAAFAPEQELPALLAIFNSRPFDFLLSVRAGKVGGVQYESGLIQAVPTPNLSSEACEQLSRLARRAWSLKRSLDTVNETSHAFLLPPGLNERITELDRCALESELTRVQREIDDRAFELYSIGPEDRAVIEESSLAAARSEDGADEVAEEDNETEAESLDAGETAAVISWLVGVAFGRFDPRLATGERAVPPEPEPFDPLPSRSPGMWPESETPEDAPGILVDDEGHAADLTARVKQIAEQTQWRPPDGVRAWLAREFFPLHIKMYSKSRRKAPIYWQLATRSGSYSVWLYIHAFTKDTLFRVQHDYARPKLLHEERRLETLRQEAGENPSAAQRKRIAAQEIVVQEIRVFLEEVKRVAPLWNPDLDDGVILNFAPLWRLVPQCASWQKELKANWKELCEEKYDWSHLAMHLWPERVVRKCAKDRSLAIAHGLEEVFWMENGEGKWEARETPTRSVDELIRERTSPAVKAALESLLQAPVAQNGRGRSRGRRASVGSA